MQKTKELATETSCMNSALHDEYVFVLLARDAASPVAIDAWCAERIRTGKNIESDQLINEARGCAAAMRVTRHDVRVRLGKADPGQAGKAQQREAESVAPGPTQCVCGHAFLSHQVDYDIRPNCRGGCTVCMCEVFRDAPARNESDAVETGERRIPGRAATMCARCGCRRDVHDGGGIGPCCGPSDLHGRCPCPAWVERVALEAAALPKFITIANGEQAMTLCKTCREPVIITDVNCSKCKTVASDPPNDREIALIGHNLDELPKLSPEARRRVAVYVKRFVDDTEPNRGAPVPDPVGIVEAYARCGASLRGLDRNQAKRVLLAVAAMLDVDLTTRA